jgi:hypothetical protein
MNIIGQYQKWTLELKVNLLLSTELLRVLDPAKYTECENKGLKFDKPSSIFGSLLSNMYKASWPGDIRPLELVS